MIPSQTLHLVSHVHSLQGDPLQMLHLGVSDFQNTFVAIGLGPEILQNSLIVSHNLFVNCFGISV